MTDAERIAQRFHETYETLAPQVGWTTQVASRVPWEEVPEENKHLMVATVNTLLQEGVIRAGDGLQGD